MNAWKKVLFSALVGAAGLCHAQSGAVQSASPPEPLSFKGFTLGALRSEINLSGLQCHENKKTDIEFSCFHSAKLNPTSEAGFATIAGVRSQFFHLAFFADRLAAVTIKVDRADYGVVVGALTQRYGEPTKKDVVYSNGYGAKFTGRQADWSLASGTISAEENAQGKTSTVQFTMAGFAELLRDRQKAKSAAGKDDL